MGNLFWFVIAIIIISSVVGAVAKLLNNMNEMNKPARNRPAPRADGGGGGGGGVVRQSSSDMDRFLAEIDRLRKKNADAPPPQRGESVPVAPVVQPAKQPEKPRPRVVAELAEPVSRPTDMGFGPPVVPTATTGPKAGDLPMASVVTLPAGTGAGHEGDAAHVGRASDAKNPIREEPHHSPRYRPGPCARHCPQRGSRHSQEQEVVSSGQ